MNTIELIKDAAFFGGNIPNERLKECRDFFDNVIEKQCTIHVVGVTLVCDIEKGTRCIDQYIKNRTGVCRNCGGQAN